MHREVFFTHLIQTSIHCLDQSLQHKCQHHQERPLHHVDYLDPEKLLETKINISRSTDLLFFPIFY